MALLWNKTFNSTSMRADLLVWTFVPLMMLVSISTTVADKLAAEFANEQFDSFLVNSADSIAARLSLNANGVVVADIPTSMESMLRHNDRDHFFYQIVDSSGRTIAGDAQFPP